MFHCRELAPPPDGSFDAAGDRVLATSALAARVRADRNAPCDDGGVEG